MQSMEWIKSLFLTRCKNQQESARLLIPRNENILKAKICGSCQEDLQSVPPVPLTHLDCHPSHIFHKNCIDQWVAHKKGQNEIPRCPYCKVEIIPEGTPGLQRVGKRVIEKISSNRPKSLGASTLALFTSALFFSSVTFALAPETHSVSALLKVCTAAAIASPLSLLLVKYRCRLDGRAEPRWNLHNHAITFAFLLQHDTINRLLYDPTLDEPFATAPFKAKAIDFVTTGTAAALSAYFMKYQTR